MFSCACYRMITAHPMHSAAWRCRRRTQENVRQRRAVQPSVGTQEELPEMHGPAADIAAHQVGIVSLECGRAENVACQNMRSEAGSEALDLRFDGIREVGLWSHWGRDNRPKPVCLPWGARLKSNRLGWASRTKGAPEWFASHGAISSSVPPRCTVPARRHACACPGYRRVQSPIELEDAGP